VARGSLDALQSMFRASYEVRALTLCVKRAVFQNRTDRHEVSGGYLWSPKRNANKARNPFYESMREVSPGDIIFSFRDTRIAALGIARSYCYESPKPTEFGTAGSYWEAIGWKLDVSFRELTNRIHPKSHIGELRGLLPQNYSPLRANGDNLQSVYLAEVGRPFAAALFRLIGGEANQVKDVAKEVDRAEHLSPSREPVNDTRSESNTTSAKTPRSPTPNAKPSSWRASGRGCFAPMCRASSAPVA
jgi:putative restriction endonuclease